MIFVTVGTHEQPFNRLIEYMDNWAGEHDEDVVMQTGFSTYQAKNCVCQRLFPYKEMLKMVNNARIVITHGGPSSFIMPLQIGKIPVVVPRKLKFNEHVNDHQVEFSNEVAKRKCNIIVVENINELSNILEKYNSLILQMPNSLQSNNEKFCREFGRIVDGMVKNK